MKLPTDKQEIFDTVATHLLKQNAKSVSPYDNKRCYYRGKDGLKCAIGCLIPDELYDENLECHTVFELLADFPDRFDMWLDCSIASLLNDLQRVHDTDGMNDWPDELRLIAHMHDLDTYRLTIEEILS